MAALLLAGLTQIAGDIVFRRFLEAIFESLEIELVLLEYLDDRFGGVEGLSWLCMVLVRIRVVLVSWSSLGALLLQSI